MKRPEKKKPRFNLFFFIVILIALFFGGRWLLRNAVRNSNDLAGLSAEQLVERYEHFEAPVPEFFYYGSDIEKRTDDKDYYWVDPDKQGDEREDDLWIRAMLDEKNIEYSPANGSTLSWGERPKGVSEGYGTLYIDHPGSQSQKVGVASYNYLLNPMNGDLFFIGTRPIKGLYTTTLPSRNLYLYRDGVRVPLVKDAIDFLSRNVVVSSNSAYLVYRGFTYESGKKQTTVRLMNIETGEEVTLPIPDFAEDCGVPLGVSNDGKTVYIRDPYRVEEEAQMVVYAMDTETGEVTFLSRDARGSNILDQETPFEGDWQYIDTGIKFYMNIDGSQAICANGVGLTLYQQGVGASLISEYVAEVVGFEKIQYYYPGLQSIPTYDYGTYWVPILDFSEFLFIEGVVIDPEESMFDKEYSLMRCRNGVVEPLIEGVLFRGRWSSTDPLLHDYNRESQQLTAIESEGRKLVRLDLKIGGELIEIDDNVVRFICPVGSDDIYYLKSRPAQEGESASKDGEVYSWNHWARGASEPIELCSSGSNYGENSFTVSANGQYVYFYTSGELYYYEPGKKPEFVCVRELEGIGEASNRGIVYYGEYYRAEKGKEVEFPRA